MSIQNLAQRIESAIKAGADLRAAVKEAYSYLDSLGITTAVHVGVSGDHVLVFLPGYGPLSVDNPSQYVILSKRVT